MLASGAADTQTDLCRRHNLSLDDLIALSQDPVFVSKVDEYKNELANNGTSFRLKARVQAEELLMTSWQLIHDPSTPSNVKADLIKSTVRWGDLEPAKSSSTEAGDQSGVKVIINFGDKAAPVTVDATAKE